MVKHTSLTLAGRRTLFACLAALSVLLAVFLAVHFARPVSANSLEGHADFSDIEEGDIYHRLAVDYLIGKNVLQSDDGGCNEQDLLEFCPDDEMPRWQVAVWLARAVNVVNGDTPDPTDLPNQASFSDVDIDDDDIWWAPHVEFIFEEGITGGCGEDSDGNKKFCPDDKASRAQMATLLDRTFNVRDADSLEDFERNIFADVAEDNDHAEAIDAIYAAKITLGCTQKPQIVNSGTAEADYDPDKQYFCPSGDSPRQQMATLLARAMTWKIDGEADIFTPPEKDDSLIKTGADRNLIVGSLFIGSLSAAIIFGRIYYDGRKRAQTR